MNRKITPRLRLPQRHRSRWRPPRLEGACQSGALEAKVELLAWCER